MKLSQKEKQICYHYSAIWPDFKVRCCECPLVIHNQHCICKASATEEEWNEFLDDLRWSGSEEAMKRLNRALLKDPAELKKVNEAGKLTTRSERRKK